MILIVNSGNNVITRNETPMGNTDGTAYETSSNLTFDYRQDPTQEPTTSDNMNAAIVNAFYIVNTIHDISYTYVPSLPLLLIFAIMLTFVLPVRYGFTEKTFNFQSNNFGKGGKGNDRITVSVQDKAGMDNADFSTPPDGQSGHMRMFLWDYTTVRHLPPPLLPFDNDDIGQPGRDGALENSIVVHENTHGITNRMTGGGTGRCLQTMEAGGLGEGWSDAMAE